MKTTSKSLPAGAQFVLAALLFSNSMWAVQGNSPEQDSHKRVEELDLLVEFS